MATYRIGTITGTQAGLSVTAIVQEVEWSTSATEKNHQLPTGAIYASNLINPRGEVKISAVVPRQYANIPAAGGMITVSGCTMGNGLMSLDLDGTSGQSFTISGSRVVASNKSTATLEITGYAYLEADASDSGSASFEWILTDEHPAEDEYKNTVSFKNPDPTRYAFAISIVTMRRTTQTKTWRKAIPADQAAPVRPNPGNLSPTGWDATNGRVGRWVCIDGGCSRPYFLNGEIVKETWVTWQMVSDWEQYHSDYTEEKEESSSNA